MKTRPLLLLVLLAGVIILLGWLYTAVMRPAMAVPTEQRAQMVEDLSVCCRLKHGRAAQLDHYARIADEEQATQTAQLFRAIAHAERVQERHCAELIRRAGGSYRPPHRLIILRNTTQGNLAAAVKSMAVDSATLKRIAYHLREGNRLAARALVWAVGGEVGHRKRLEEALYHQSRPVRGYRVCPTCGLVSEAEYPHPYCPQCLTEGRMMVSF